MPSRAYVVDPWPMLVRRLRELGGTDWMPDWFDMRPLDALTELVGGVENLGRQQSSPTASEKDYEAAPSQEADRPPVRASWSG